MTSIFQLPLIPNFTTNFEFETVSLESGDGKEVRCSKLNEYKLKTNLNNLLLKQEEVDYILGFFRDRKGKAENFYFKSWTDFKATETPDYYDTDQFVYSQGIALEISGSNGLQYQLMKRYTVGSVNAYKTILAPNQSTIRLYDGGTELSGFTVDPDTGVVTFTTAPGAITGWAGEFYIPCRFDTDDLPVAKIVQSDDDGCDWYSLSNLPICEDIYGRVAVEQATDYVKLPIPFSMARLPIFDESDRFETLTENLESGSETRFIRQEPKKRINYNSTILNSKEVNYLLTYFVVSRGKHGSFTLEHQGEKLSVRFDTDSLSLAVIAPDCEDDTYMYEMGDVSFLETRNASPTIEDLVDRDTYVNLIYDNTGSMSGIAGPLNDALVQIRDRLLFSVFDGDQAALDQHVPAAVANGTEQWLNMMRTGTLSPKSLNVVFINESEPTYHPSGAQSNGGEPTSAYLSDLADFIAAVSPNDNFKARIVEPITSFLQQSTADIFEDHLVNAIEGTGGYPDDLTNYDIEYRLNFPIDSTVDEYVKLIESIFSDTDIGKFIDISTSCRCVKIARRDGVLFGFTDHDKDLTIAGLVYASRTAINPTASEIKADLSIDNQELRSVLSSDAITDADLVAGKYDGAEVTVALVDFTNLPDSLDNGLHVIMKGIVGEVRSSDTYYKMETLSKPAALLNRNNSKKVQPLCPYQFGDAKCGIDLNASGYVHLATVSAVTSNSTFQIDTSFANDLLSFGLLAFTSGLNIGLKFEILSQQNNEIRLFVGTPYVIVVGDTLTITQGCKKTTDACKGYNNFVNFGGFPSDGNFIPGSDYLLASPSD